MIFGFWLVPLLITIGAFFVSYRYLRHGDPMNQMVGGILTLTFYGFSIIVSLIAWLVYFIIV